MLYQRDYLILLVKYGLEEPSGGSRSTRSPRAGFPSALGADAAAAPHRPGPSVAAQRCSGDKAGAGPDPAMQAPHTLVDVGEMPRILRSWQMPLRRSPLDIDHRAMGARMISFGGWEMPLSYPDGTLSEHLACRRKAVAFDVSHLGTVRVSGAAAYDGLQVTFTNDLARIGPGRAQYTHLLDERDASVVDDLIVWWVDGRPGDATASFDVMPNASNTSRVVAALATTGARALDVTASRAVIAVQGPDARARLGKVAPGAAGVARLGVERFEWEGVGCVAAGTGYTGEDGAEVMVPADAASGFWHALLDAGLTPAGLGARDTLRLEAGLPLHGHELGPGITPLQVGLGWVVGWDKPTFRGREALVAEQARGVRRRLRGLATRGRQPPREGNAVLGGDPEARPLGVVTSGNFSPVLGTGIALALLAPEVDQATEVTIDARGRHLDARVVPLPFVGGRARR